MKTFDRIITGAFVLGAGYGGYVISSQSATIETLKELNRELIDNKATVEAVRKINIEQQNTIEWYEKHVDWCIEQLQTCEAYDDMEKALDKVEKELQSR